MKRNLLITLAALFACLSLVGCGSSKTTNEGFGAVSQASSAQNSPTSPVGNETALALCSRDANALPDSQVHLQQFVDQYGQTRSDYVRLQITNAPQAWQSGNWDLVIYRWTAASDGTTSIDSVPVSFQFERKVGSAYQLLAPDSYSIFNWEETVAMGAHAGIPTGTPQAFYGASNLVVNLRDTTNSFQALRVVLKLGGVVQRQMDVLIPTFAADPARYNTDARHPAVLQALHPLRDKLGQTWTQANYFEFAKALCF
jgi:hypothetical protein